MVQGSGFTVHSCGIGISKIPSFVKGRSPFKNPRHDRFLGGLPGEIIFHGVKGDSPPDDLDDVVSLSA